MRNVEFVYTFGMDESEIDRLLADNDTGVLSLADGDDAYAVPVAYDYDGDTIALRLGVEDDSTKLAFAETTETATFVVYDADLPDRSWSVLVRGRLRETADADATEINERFPAIRVFDEPIDEIDVRVYELVAREVTGRRTGE